MGKAVASSEEGMEEESWSSDMVKGMSPPQMVLRVLLVEADDSTRLIIAALLRKCSYRGTLSFYLWMLSVYSIIWFGLLLFFG